MSFGFIWRVWSHILTSNPSVHFSIVRCVVSVGPGSSFQALTGSWPTAQAIFSLSLGQVTRKEPGKKWKKRTRPLTSIHFPFGMVKLVGFDDSSLWFFGSNSLFRGHAGLDFQEGEDAIVLLPWVWWCRIGMRVFRQQGSFSDAAF